MSENIFIGTCGGCNAPVLTWPASPTSICHRCELHKEQKQNEREQHRLEQWSMKK